MARVVGHFFVRNYFPPPMPQVALGPMDGGLVFCSHTICPLAGNMCNPQLLTGLAIMEPLNARFGCSACLRCRTFGSSRHRHYGCDGTTVGSTSAIGAIGAI